MGVRNPGVPYLSWLPDLSEGLRLRETKTAGALGLLNAEAVLAQRNFTYFLNN